MHYFHSSYALVSGRNFSLCKYISIMQINRIANLFLKNPMKASYKVDNQIVFPNKKALKWCVGFPSPSSYLHIFYLMLKAQESA